METWASEKSAMAPTSMAKTANPKALQEGCSNAPQRVHSTHLLVHNTASVETTSSIKTKNVTAPTSITRLAKQKDLRQAPYPVIPTASL
jgi:hypothetical protein